MKDEKARDKAIEKLVARGLRRQTSGPGPAGAGCLDAETLAAYVERTITTEEKVSCEAHLSSCLHCQEQVAHLVRVSEGEAEGEPAYAGRPARAARLGGPYRATLTGFRWAWAAPALVAMVVAGLWYTGEFKPLLQMRQETSTPAPSLPPPAAATAKKEAQPAPSTADQRETQFAAAAAKEEAKAISGRAHTPKSPGQGAGFGGGIGRGVGTVVAPDVAQDKLAPSVPAAGGAAAQHAEPAATPERTIRSEGQAAQGVIATPSERSRLAGLEGTDVRREAGPAVPSQPGPPKVAKEQEAPMTGVAADQAMRAEKMGARAKGFGLSNATKSFVPVPANWRVGPHGLIERRSPEGNWVPVPSGVETDLFAVAFPTPTVGWVVGSGGTVLLTTDGGTTWEKVAFPTTDDLVRVSAQSGQVAWVWTRTGGSFLTSNRGKSWKHVR